MRKGGNGKGRNVSDDISRLFTTTTTTAVATNIIIIIIIHFQLSFKITKCAQRAALAVQILKLLIVAFIANVIAHGCVKK